MPDAESLQRLLADELVSMEQGSPRTTRRWQRAMVRAAARLYGDAVPFDLRYPITLALLDIYREGERELELDDTTLARLVETMLPIEEAELAPTTSRLSGTTRP
jgi:hypothetical protein